MKNLSSKTVKELREYALENDIDLGDAKTKTKILSILLGGEASISLEPVEEQTIIKANEPVKKVPASSSASDDNGVVVSKYAKNSVKKTTETLKEEVEKVALFSEKNLHWLGVGNIRPGYNIVTEEASKLWLTRRGVREATPEEVATYYGKS
jgi:hypothetical protein